MSRQLPAQPNLEVLRKQARQLLNEHAADHSEAVARVRAVSADLPSAAAKSSTLRQAQQVLAREYGFANWQALLNHVEGDAGFSAHGDFYSRLASDLVDAQRGGHLQSFGQLGRQFADRRANLPASPGGVDGGDEAEIAIEHARQTIAENNGFDSWQGMARAANECHRTNLLTKEQLAGLERLHVEFARSVGARFAAVTGDPSIEGKISFLDLTTYGWILRSLSSPSCSFVGSMDGFEGDILCDIGPNLATGLVAADIADREQQLSRLAEDIYRDLTQAWQPVAALQATRIVPHTDPFSMHIVPICEICVLVAIEMTASADGAGLPGLLSLCFPVPAIAAAVDAQWSAPDRHT
ncbi:MAG: hypothetical protein O2782_09245 [bacterium]|nr:hypothetical protein [bacterium]